MRKIVSALLTAAVVASMFASATFAGGGGNAYGKIGDCQASWDSQYGQMNGCYGGKKSNP